MRWLVLSGLLALAATAAQAEEKLLTGAPPAWVKPGADIAAEAPPAEGAPVRILRLDRQLNFGPSGDAAYQEMVSQVRAAAGLTSAGTFSLSWDPSRDTVTVHKLKIIRQGETIDVLAKQSFTVIRREANLSQLVDGRLTATIQPEDLRVGDMVAIAYTIVHADPVLKGRTDFSLNLNNLRNVETATLRATWPASEHIAWRAGSGLEPPKLAKRGSEVELSLELKNAKPLEGPKGAPRRYTPTRELEFSAFGSWAEVVATVAPQFQKAAILAPDSPLKAEVAKIRAQSADPKVQAAAALKLVQDQVRYLGLLLTDGGYTPVDADKTWARRFGECKAKATLLVALLHELGIEAEPALVNAYNGDDVERSLPRMSAFNHVIVRAVIGGKTYWLDGTRTGDGALDTLTTPAHKWALPIRAEGAKLVALVQTPLAEPSSEIALEVDATRGISAPAPVHGAILMRGDAGRLPNFLLANSPVADREKALKSMWAGYPWIDVKTVELSNDPETGVTRLTMEGTAKLRWTPSPSGGLWLVPPAGSLGSRADFKRDPGPGADAPFAVTFPTYTANQFTIRLPKGGEGFATLVPEVNKTLAGRALQRRVTVDGDRVTITASTKSLASEFPASEAAAAAEELTQLANERIGIQSPRNYRGTDADVEAWLAETPKTSIEFGLRGSRLMIAGRKKEGLADFDKAVELDPKSAAAYAGRGQARVDNGQGELAKADFEQAVKLDPRNSVVQGFLGSTAIREGRFDDAVVALTRAADLTANNMSALTQRAIAYRALDETSKALADYDELLRIDPKFYQAHQGKAEIYASHNQFDQALTEMDAALTTAPSDQHMQIQRAVILSQLDRRADANAAFAAVIKAKPSMEAYLARAASRPKDDLQGRLADADAAEKLGPKNPAILNTRARAYVDAGKAAEALPMLDREISANPKSRGLLEWRALAYVKSGQTAAALKDFASARALSAGNAGALNNLCWTEATLGVGLEAALDDCLAALSLQPAYPSFIDSKAFALLRLGRAKEAIETYDLAVRLRPQQAASLYGRGLAKRKFGMTAGGDADIAAAEKLNPKIQTEFAGYGVTP